MAAKFTRKEVYDYYIGGWRSADAGDLKDHFDFMEIELSDDEFQEFIETLEDFEECENPDIVDWDEVWVVREEPRGDNGDIFEWHFHTEEDAVEYAKCRFTFYSRKDEKERHLCVGHGCSYYGWADRLRGQISDFDKVVWDSLEGGDC